jgi:hypothetical protein
MSDYVVEHEFITDNDAKDVTRAVGVQGQLQGRLLALIAYVVLVNDVDGEEDLNVGLGLLDRLQHERGLVAVTVVESNASCDLRENLHVYDRVGEILVASRPEWVPIVFQHVLLNDPIRQS